MFLFSMFVWDFYGIMNSYAIFPAIIDRQSLISQLRIVNHVDVKLQLVNIFTIV